jgi:putative ABC transport system permease protein
MRSERQFRSTCGPFRIVGIFEYYEREEDKRRRELDSTINLHPAAVDERRGMNRGGPFGRKNSQIVIPITTAFYEFRSANVIGKEDQGPNRKLDGLVFQVADTKKFRQTLDRVTEILKITHRGIEDFGFDTREEWFDRIEQNARNVRLRSD